MKTAFSICSLFVMSVLVSSSLRAQSQSTELEAITATLVDYIEGSTNGQPDRLKKAFHKDLNLYYAKDGELKTWSGAAYIADTKEGIPT
ncbi:MAG: nuclear transport factor 2 family protein, partial [Bacteroidota bacterium]